MDIIIIIAQWGIADVSPPLFHPRQKNVSTDVSSPSIIKIGYLAPRSYIDLFIPTHRIVTF